MPVQKFTEVIALSDHTSNIIANLMPTGRFRVAVTLPQVERKKKKYHKSIFQKPSNPY